MKIKKLLEYKISGGRNSTARNILLNEDKLFVTFLYDKGRFYESLILCMNPDDFTILWEYRYNHVIFNIFISQHNTLIADFMDGNIASFDLENGQVLWNFKTDKQNIGLISNESEGKAVFSGIQRTRSTWCIDTATGNVIWKVDNSGHSYVPVIHGSKVYNTIEHQVFCTSLADGKAIWENSEPETYLTNIHVFKKFIIATGHGIFNVYDLETGVLCGTAQTGVSGAIGWMTSENNTIYFGDESGYFYCYALNPSGNEVTIERVWKIDVGGKIRRAALISGDCAWIAADNVGFLCVTKENGAIALEKKIKGEGSILTLKENKIYFAAKMSLFQFEIQ